MEASTFRKDIIDALRRGTVPRRGLDLFAVGTDRFFVSLKEELDRCATGGAVSKALRGDFGCGKSFTARWYQQQALARGFAVAEVQISENDTPLHRLETIYRRATEGLRTAEWDTGAFRAIISQWLMGLEEEVSRTLRDPDDLKALAEGVGNLLEARLKDVSAVQPQYAAVLRAYHAAEVAEDHAVAEGLIAWLMGQPNVSADIKKRAGIKGEIDHTGALGFLRGLLAVLKQTIQRVRSDSRDKSLEAIRKLIDDLYGGRFSGLYILITGTPAFFDGPNGVKRLPPQARRGARSSTLATRRRRLSLALVLARPVLTLLERAGSEQVREFAAAALKTDFRASLREVEAPWVVRLIAVQSATVDQFVRRRSPCAPANCGPTPHTAPRCRRSPRAC